VEQSRATLEEEAARATDETSELRRRLTKSEAAAVDDRRQLGELRDYRRTVHERVTAVLSVDMLADIDTEQLPDELRATVDMLAQLRRRVNEALADKTAAEGELQRVRLRLAEVEPKLSTLERTSGACQRELDDAVHGWLFVGRRGTRGLL